MLKDLSSSSSPLVGKHDVYFVQGVSVGTELVGVSRFDVFTSLLRGRDVLHVGYADWPITDLSANLHAVLAGVCRRLDGVDPHDEADELLRQVSDGSFYRSTDDVTQRYDVVLAPEVMEHVGNVEAFLQGINRVDFESIIITVPDALQCRGGHFDYQEAERTAVEVVHPDHNYWFSPYTLFNTVRKYTDWNIEGMWFLNNISLMLMASKPATSVD